MKIRLVLVDENDMVIAEGALVESGIVDATGTVYSEEAIRSMFDQFNKIDKTPVVINAGVVE